MGFSDLKVQAQQFASNKYVQGGKDFLQSNSIVARFAFIILALLVFMFLLSLGTFILSLVFSQKHKPILIDGMINSTQMMIIPQNPSKKGAKPIMRSDNEREGLEFTWSVWIYIDDFSYKETEYKHIFHKGNNSINLSGVNKGINSPINGPGLYITPRRDDAVKGNVAGLRCIMNTFDNIDKNIEIKNIPLNKWVCVIIRVTKQGQLDAYINGALVKRLMLGSIPRQNYGDVYVSLNGGFSGNTSNLRYFEKAIGTNQIQSIFNSGPNMKFVSGDLRNKADTNKYLATRWFMTTATDS